VARRSGHERTRFPATGTSQKTRPRHPRRPLTASGSGLNPHISLAAAHFQIARIAAARKLSDQAIAALIASKTETPQLGLLGEPRVNVLARNRALAALK